MEFLEDPTEKWKLKEIVIKEINIIKIIEEYNIILEKSGKNCRTYCPFHEGKNGGKERTPSFNIFEETNSFYCFGCGISGSVIDFVSLIEGIPPINALSKLIERLENPDEINIRLNEDFIFEAKKNIEPYLFEISFILRNYIKKFIGMENFEKELIFMEKIAFNVDKHIDKIGYEDWEYAEDILNKVKKIISKRK